MKDFADVEQMVIGSVFKSPELLSTLGLRADDFQTGAYQDIYRHCLNAAQDGRPIAPFEIAQTLKRETGQDYYGHISDMLNALLSTRQAEAGAKYLKTQAQCRKVKAIAEALITAADNENLSELDGQITSLMRLGQTSERHDRSVNTGLTESLKRLEMRMEKKDLPGATTGLQRLDETLFGWHPTRFYVFGARPAMGKTALLLNFALAHKGRAGIFSGEQDFSEMVDRLVNIESGIDSSRFQTGMLQDHEWSQLTKSVEALKKRDSLRIYDKPGMTLSELVCKAREWRHRYQIDVLFVDYLQLIRVPGKERRDEEVGTVAATLKNLAKELQVPVVTLAQVNRQCEARPDKRPTASDMANSGEIERYADVIATIYRDEVYNSETPEKGIAEINIVKNRHGPVCKVRTVFKAAQMQFRNLSAEGYNE